MIISRLRKNNLTKIKPVGFTLVEVMITVLVIAILATLATPQLDGVVSRSRDNERASKITIISEALEKFYQQNGEYPTCTDLTKSAQTVVTDTLKQVDPVVLAAPGAAAGTNSITCDVNSVDNFVYKINTDGSYTLTYTKEADNTAVPLIGRYTSINTLGDTVISPTLINNNQIDISWTAVTDATQYRVQRSTDGSFATGVTDITTTELAMSSTGLNSGVKYYFRVMAKSINASSNWIAVDYATTITTPAAPVVTANTAGDTTTWSWPAVTCSVGTANYQYRYTSAGFDSGLAATTGLSVPFTTIVENQTYTVAVQSRCSTTDTSSDWSVAGSASYIRPYADWIVIGTQTWAKTNLNIGTMVTGATAQTDDSIIEKYCYNDNEANCSAYGALYQWDEAMNYSVVESTRGICPVGAHIPSDTEWKVLEMSLSGMTQATADLTGWRGVNEGTKLKFGGESGLNIPLAGIRSDSGSFMDFASDAALWSSSESSTRAWRRNLDTSAAGVNRYYYGKTFGFSIRCLMD